mgnify:CR=1 FL=1
MTEQTIVSSMRSFDMPTHNHNLHKDYTSAEWTEGGYFQAVLEFIKEMKVTSFMDVGGCTGEVSNILLENIPSIENGVIFEPQPENYQYILDNVKSDKVLVENKALFYGEEYLELSVRDSNVGSWSILFGNQYPGNSVRVQCVDIDDYLKETKYDFIKIDIEGAEYSLFQNSKLLKEVDFLEIELHHEHFDIYKDQNSNVDLSKYVRSDGGALKYAMDYFSEHELHYFMSGETEQQQKNPGNIFLVKKDLLK